MGLFGNSKSKVKNKKSSTLAESATVTSRASEAKTLEEKKLGIKRELEELMVAFSKETGDKSYKARKYKVGKAPNDWRASRKK